MKKLLALFLAIIMTLTVTACGQASSAPPAAASGPAPSAPASADDGTAASVKPAGYPEGGNVTVVCGYAAGGAADNACRALAQYASILSGDNYIVTNIEGSSGRIAAADVTASPADGLKLFMSNLVLCDPQDFTHIEDKDILAQIVDANMKAKEEFDVICAMYDEARTITIRADDPRFSTWEELDAYMRAHPGELTVGTSGANNAGGLMATLLAEKLGYEFNVVHYTSTSELHPALLGGHVDVEMATISAASTDGELAKTIAIASEERSAVFPDIPTFLESGTDLVIPMSRCFFVKKGTDPAIIEYLSRLCGEMAGHQPFIDDNLNIYSATVNYRSAAESQALIDEVYAACAELLK